ncbi:type IV pilin N-terminal domain-containing protein [Methanosarcina sp. T3]|uniref:type IV pilin N-terminal domain-containing protein n=1 Tax=Methanosarcina sp. T3 TaxID=3439062 RepID=UPI003F878748
MPNVKKLMENRKAVSEVVGEVLLTSIAVLLVSSIGIFISTYDGATDVPHTQVREWMNTGSDTVYLEHSGGEFLEVENLEIVININGQRYVYPRARVYSNINNNSNWQLGDRITINTSREWGIDIESDDEIQVFLVDSPSKQIIQYLTVSSGEGAISGWITPSSARDTSGGTATPLDVYMEGDGISTSYHAPGSSDPSKFEEFSFGGTPALWGLFPGDNVTDVTLKIVYRVEANSCKDIKLKIYDGSPIGNWHEENIPVQTEFAEKSINLYPYINNTEDLAKIKVQLVAVENSAVSADKRLNVDYMAIYAN